MFDTRITLGDILPWIIGIFFGLTLFIYKQWLALRPFEVNFVTNSVDWPPQPARKQRRAPIAQLTLGESYLYLEIKPKVGTSFDEIDVRFVGRYLTWRWTHVVLWLPRPRLWDFRPAPTSSIEIKEIEEAELKRQGGNALSVHGFTRRPNGVGGFIAWFTPPYFRAPEDSLWITLRVQAHRPWNGLIEFRSYNSAKHRGYMRRSVLADAEHKAET